MDQLELHLFATEIAQTSPGSGSTATLQDVAVCSRPDSGVGQSTAKVLPKPGCRECGHETPRGRNAYCSKLCQDRYRRVLKHARIPAVCEHCSAPYMVLVKARAIGAGKYCSRKCVGDAAAALGIFKGDKNPRWLGGVSKDNMRYRRRQMERWPMREAARRKLRDAVKAGRVVKKPCEHCGEAKSNGHHHDYSKPLDVTWLCRPCHDAEHARLKAKEA